VLICVKDLCWNIKLSIGGRMTLLFLCAGFATRLEPRTLTYPKHLLPFGNKKKLIDMFMDSIKNIEDKISRKILITNSKYYDQFSAWSEENDYGFELIDDGVKSKEEKLGAIGDLLFAIEKAKIDDDIMIVSPDHVYFKYDFNDLIEVSKSYNASSVIVDEGEEEEILSGSCLTLTDANQVVKFVEKPKVVFDKWHGGPTYILKKEDIERIKAVPKEKYDNIGTVGETLSVAGRLYASIFSGELIHLTTEADYQEALEKYGEE
jgi:glucose-1-phosphate thymidylyltransferase